MAESKAKAAASTDTSATDPAAESTTAAPAETTQTAKSPAQQKAEAVQAASADRVERQQAAVKSMSEEHRAAQDADALAAVDNTIDPAVYESKEWQETHGENPLERNTGDV